MNRKPNFFIIGAPKCGTTALSEYLRAHTNILISKPKEPHFFCDDFPHYRQNISSLDQYLTLFQSGNNIIAAGEASVWYLYSKVAVQNALQFNPDAKFIAMIRNPIDMAVSLHAQLVWTLDEDERDFNKAWQKASERKHGKNIPAGAREPAFLQYGEACKLGEQIQRFIAAVPAQQRLIITFDDFIKDTRKEYKKVLEFLGVPDDNKKDFPKINAAKQHKNSWVSRFTQRPPAALIKLNKMAKKMVGGSGFKIMKKIQHANMQGVDLIKPSIATKQAMNVYFREDIELLNILVKNKASSWL